MKHNFVFAYLYATISWKKWRTGKGYFSLKTAQELRMAFQAARKNRDLIKKKVYSYWTVTVGTSRYHAKRQMPPSPASSSPLLPPSPSARPPLRLRSRNYAFSRIRNKSVTGGRMDGWTERPSFRDAWTHLKTDSFFVEAKFTRPSKEEE